MGLIGWEWSPLASLRSCAHPPRDGSLTAGSTRRRKTLASNPGDVLRQIRDEKIQMVDVRFIDLPGVWQHFTLPATELEESSFEDGLGFDGSSIRGFQQIQES